jgi:signal peptidase I
MGDYRLFGVEEDYMIPADHYFMLGDNSSFSLDSRFFGAVPRRNLVGRSWFIFWPFSRRWGLTDRLPPLDIPTGVPVRGTFPVMYKQ